MKILHFISAPEDNGDVTTVYVSTLVESLGSRAEVILLNANTQAASLYKKQTKDFNPDIVHIHTCWDMPSAQMAKWAHSNNMPVVLSPHGKLEPWVVDDNYLHEKLPKLLLYQHEMICNADAIVVTGNMELQALNELSWNASLKSKKPWNDRVCIIKNAVTTNTISNEQMAEQMVRLYRKVIDSNAGMLMSAEAREAENGLLRAGIARSERSNNITEKQIEAIQGLDDESWRKLFIHADDEDVLHLIKKGIEEMQFTAPHIVIQDIERFAQRLPKARGPLESENVAEKTLRSRFKPWEEVLLKDKDDNPVTSVELDFCRMIANTQHEMKKATLSLRHLTDIYQLMRFTELDEELISRILKDTELYEFTQQLQQTLSQTLGLTEGYMIVES
ncbi:MAG: glycosyltransferase [Prevotella sp.]|nr:glycosyltransferase [Prevotella sp.]